MDNAQTMNLLDAPSSPLYPDTSVTAPKPLSTATSTVTSPVVKSKVTTAPAVETLPPVQTPALKEIVPVQETVVPQNDVFGFETGRAPTGETRDLTDSQGNAYKVDSNGKIVVGPSTGQYRVGESITKYPDAYKSITGKDIKGTPEEQLERSQAEAQAEVERVNSTIDSIQNGSIPLSPGQQAQIDALKNSFQQLINQQTLINTGASGSANTRGYQSGAAEYDPTFQNKIIGSILTAGINKVSDLQTKMAAAVASLTQALKDDNIKGIKEQYDIYTKAKENHETYLQKIITQTQDEIAKQQEAIQKQQETFDKDISDIVTKMAANGAPVSLIQQVKASKDIAQAAALAGDYASGATGIVGEYQYYKRQAEASGQQPVDFNTYQNMDANRKAKVAAAATGSGYNSATVTKIQQIAGNFDNEQSVKSYQVVAEGKSFLDSIPDTTRNPSDQQGVIYAFAKIMDPNSVVREGEYNTVQKYAQSWADTFGFKASRIFSNEPFLTTEAIRNMKATINAKVKAAEKSYNNIYDEYGRRINKISGGADGKDFLTDYSKGYGGTGGDIQQKETEAETKMGDYGDSAPLVEKQRIIQMRKDGRTWIEIQEFYNVK